MSQLALIPDVVSRKLPLVGDWLRGVSAVPPAAAPDPHCRACPLGARAKSTCLPGYGDPGGLLVVSSSPTREDDQVGRSFASVSGQQLRVAVASAWAGPARFANALACAASREVDEREVGACRPYLRREWDDARPTRVVVLGDVAARAVFGVRVQPLNQRRSWGRVLGVPCFLVAHPGVTAHNRFARDWFRQDLRWALTVPDPPEPAGETTVLLDEGEVVGWLGALRPGEPVDLDVEHAVDHLGLWGAGFRLLCLGMCQDPARPAVVPGDVALRPRARAALAAFLGDPAYPKVNQRIKHDRQALWRALGADLAGIDGDTLLWAKQLDAEAPASLGALSWRVGYGGYKEAADRLLGKVSAVEERDDAGEGGAYEKLPPDELHAYCGRDVSAALLVARDQWARMDAGTRSTWRRLIGPAFEALARVERWGMLLDERNVRAFDAWLGTRADALTARVVAAAGVPPGFNPDSPDQVAALLFGALKLPVKKMTPGGKPSTDADVLEELAETSPVAKLLHERKKFVSQRNRYGLAMLDHVSPVDGRVHPTFHLVRSGRLGCREPNLQNITKPDEDADPAEDFGTQARTCFAARPGSKLVEFDYCLAPGTRILRADLRWVRVEDLSKGDEVVGFDEEIGRRSTRMRRSIVLGNRLVERPCFRVTTDRGTVVASALHGWVCRPARGRQVRRWVETRVLRVGDRISYFVAPWEEDRSWDGGWVAGLLDGEGWVSKNGVGFGQNRGATLDRALALLRGRGFDLALYESKTGCVRVMPRGERAGMRLIGTYRPPRLLPKLLWEGSQSWGRCNRPARVTAIEDLGSLPVWATETSTRTFVAEGLLSHNSQMELRTLAMLSGDEAMAAAFESGWDFHRMTGAMAHGVAPDQVTDEQRKAGKILNFALVFGLGDAGVAERVGCSRERATELRETLLGKYRVMADWLRRQVALAKATGESVAEWAPMGWKWRRPLWQIGELGTSDEAGALRAHCENVARNNPVQCVANFFSLASLVETVRWLVEDFPGPELVVTVHDSLLLDVPEAQVPEVLRVVPEVMTAWPSGCVNLAVDAKVGDVWGRLKKVPVASVKNGDPGKRSPG